MRCYKVKSKLSGFGSIYFFIPYLLFYLPNNIEGGRQIKYNAGSHPNGNSQRNTRNQREK
ncbi:hypothetical protein [Leptospira vanthielii]|uniref:DUF805 domain-containing protein n=2 Tax=Leptospira vanthielii TaxID=293085 RepID=A0ABY2NPU0_9LEPT|nr:hypothetical protein [Leptospira vanthielii]EMY71883.1 hypothetical protein LEP1GSC199_0045 [Leptospira vanthielii serovar Holland str. Waz Holland = ATCC 700522]TGM56918.1 hypothetical protein EHQ95_09830 [Leptospira vanthielii]